MTEEPRRPDSDWLSMIWYLQCSFFLKKNCFCVLFGNPPEAEPALLPGQDGDDEEVGEDADGAARDQQNHQELLSPTGGGKEILVLDVSFPCKLVVVA